jgi:hypothetical protein
VQSAKRIAWLSTVADEPPPPPLEQAAATIHPTAIQPIIA